MKLSRRSFGLVVGGVGVGSLSAGAGTYSMFSDTESSTGQVAAANDFGPNPYEEVDTTGAGTATFDQNALTIDAAGADVWEADDEYGALYKAAVSGDFRVVVDVDSQENTNGWAKAGLMVANDITDPGGSIGDVIVAVSPDNGVAMQRDVSGAGYVGTSASAGTTSYPTRLRITKCGLTLTGEFSTDGGSSWTDVRSWRNEFANGTQDVGMFVTSHNADTECLVDFSDFSLTFLNRGSPQPTAPSNLTSTGTTTSTADIDWDPGGAASGYDLVHHTISVDGTPTMAVRGSQTSATVRGLSPDTSHDLHVTVVDSSCHESQASNTVTVTTDPVASDPVTDGTTYTVENVNSGYLLDVSNYSTDEGANVIQWSGNGGANQEWMAIDNGDGTYRFEVQHSGQVLSVANGATTDGASLVQRTWNDDADQRWIVTENGDGSIRLENDGSGLVADISNGSAAEGANVVQTSAAGTTSQKWNFSAT